ncbi:MAG: cell division protein ZapA [Burkholderiales bacterium]|nr:cell division protein ZapA [Bacteroidia bacterium]
MSDVSVKVEIAGGLYTLKVKNEDESSVKQAVELINQKISEFEKNYGVKDKKDVLAMVTLQLVSQLVKEKNHAEQELSTLSLILEDVEKMLVLHKENIKQTGE